MPPLPPGWSTSADAAGDVFYFHTISGETTWLPPRMPQCAPPELPPGPYLVIYDAEGDPYYYNKATGRTSWFPPAPPPALPAGWRVLTDKEGDPFYVHDALGVKTWYPPNADGSPRDV